MGHRNTAAIESVATPWLDLIVVCGKCSKKLDGGFGDDGEDSLARALKHELRASGRRRTVRVLESKCLGLCPKGAVTVLPGRNPGAMLTIAAGVAASTVLETIIPQA